MKMLFVATALFGSLASQSQVATAPSRGLERDTTDGLVVGVTPVPWGPGERAEYQLSVGLFGTVGDGFLEVPEVEDIRGHDTYHIQLGIKGSVLFGAFKVDDTFQSWLDVNSLVARRFQKNQKEDDFVRNRTFDFYPDNLTWHWVERDRSGFLPSNDPLDEVSMFFFVRTLPLEVGDSYTFNRYFKAEDNPVRIEVVRKERVKVPAGEFDTIVVRPIIKTDGIFGEESELEVYFTDDERRVLVLMESKAPWVRSLTLKLTNYQEGQKLP
ncbi:MAG: DUF3108 domain-containing protein [Gemmatimonadota bacterium]